MDVSSYYKWLFFAINYQDNFFKRQEERHKMKKAMTVTGPVPVDRLGHILPHEHILMEFPPYDRQVLYPEISGEKVSLQIFGKLQRSYWSCKDNLRLDDVQVATEEVAAFGRSGGGTIVEMTNVGLKRDIKAIAQISRGTGVNIVVGTGYYVQIAHPQEVASRSVDEIAAWMVSEVTQGIEDSGVRAGIIGEIGISNLHPDEAKTLRAAARAHHATGAPISIHQVGGQEIPGIDAILREEGVQPGQVILCHMSSADTDHQRWALEHGYNVEFDDFGNEFYDDALIGSIVRDLERVRALKAWIDAGYLGQLLVSHDICLKMLLKTYGGWGYDHLLLNVAPLMLREGIAPETVRALLYTNPMQRIAYLD
jgi:phosphotriesterase-related protein